MRATPTIAFASVLLGTVAALAAPANAACKKFGFTVNDYGKDGPTNDAKNLLDKHITEWAAKNGVTDYSTGKKTVSCELFLDVILFDEHTCTASATVCWGADAKKLGSQSAAAPAEESPSGAPPAPVRKAEALGTATQQAAAPAAAPEADVSTDAPATDTAAVEAAPTTPVEHIAAPAETPAAAPAVHTAPPAAQPAPSQAAAPAAPATTGAVVETGALQAGQNFAPQDQRRATAVAPEPDRAAAAAAAASAAAAAERAAQAAETAANAAKEAAAAAVAASAASKRGATVPPLNHASGSQPPHAE